MTPQKARAELAACDYLSCWCSLDAPCHIDEYIRAIHCDHRFRDVEGARAVCQDCGKLIAGGWAR